MARLARLIVPGAAHHVLQRGNNRQPVFTDETDRKSYLDALREATRLHGVRVHGYVLANNHVHLLVTPQASDSLARAMQTLGRRYVAAFNRRHGRSGTLWEGRYRTTLVDAPSYLLSTLRYLEQQPMRDPELGGDAVLYPWSSARHHLGLHRDPLISEHPDYWAQGNTPFEREARHRQALQTPLEPPLLALLRRHVHSGWPLLSATTAKALAADIDRPLQPRPAGRPVKATAPKHSVPD